MTLKDKNLYYVGGVVRDEILGTASFDTDFCYEGNAIEFAQGLDIVKTNPDFGTVRVLYDGKEIDIASTREESYPSAGHLPVVRNIGCSLKDDLKRRDFTINAMAKNTLSGELVDFFGGINDIKEKKLRILHQNSFIDDPTRIVRGLKFAIRFGFELEEKTKKIQQEYLENINYDMSFHRLKKELKETFNLNKNEAFDRFIEQGIYKLLGDIKCPCFKNKNIAALINKYLPTSPWIVYLGLFDLSNLELTGEEKEIINSIPKTLPQTDFEAYKMFYRIPLESILLYALSVDYDCAINYLDNLQHIKIELTGDDLKKLGIPQGKIYKDIFDKLLEEKIKNPKINELEFARSLYESV